MTAFGAASLPLVCRRPGGVGSTALSHQGELEARTDDATGARVVCRACGNWLADADAVLPASASPLVFANPHGRVFELVLLASARGVVSWGEATAEHTWFRGYAWTVVLCSRCGAHVGWRYAAVAGSSPPCFFGLVRAHVATVGRDFGSAPGG